MRNIVIIILVSALGGALTLGAYKVFFEEPQIQTIVEEQPAQVMRTGIRQDAPNDFTYAANKTVNSVVHVKTAVETMARSAPQSPLEYFFGNPQQRGQGGPRLQMGSGSGVIISEDGYIVTNNHVIENAEKIQIVLNSGLEYEAKVVGTDPTTDIALIKVDAEALPFLTFQNSDLVEVGEWVLAVGNPFNLTSTVTAGIVSAKSRNIGIIAEQTAIESFIQTDAAVNPGNSGGALVNTSGELVGINSAISTRTGSYEGYSFAVPSNIVKKVVEDLLEYGTVQRAFIGVSIADITPRMAEEFDIDVTSGVYVQGVSEGGAAQDAGIESGDVIVSVNDREVTKSSELQEIIGRRRPGDEVEVTVIRDGDQKTFEIELRNLQGTTDVVKPNENAFVAKLGGELKPLTSSLKKRLGISHGVVISEVTGGILAQERVPEGFVITHINRKEIHDVEDIEDAVAGLQPRDAVVVQGFTPDGRQRYFAFGF